MPNVYISPTGSGNRSGSDLANAATLGNLNALIRKAGPGGSVLLIADHGSYSVTGPLNITAGGTAAAAVTVRGIDSKGASMDAVIEGTRPATYAAGNPSGNELFKFQAGSGNLHFQDLQINNTGTAFRAAADVSNIAIEHIGAHNVARFFEDLAGGTNRTAMISNLVIRDVNVTGFSKGVVHLRDGSHDVLIEDVNGDSQRQDGDNFAIGVHIEGGAHDVVIRRTTMANATDNEGSHYWNGDGFATELKTYNIRFEDTVARGNTDAGYDLKSTATTLVNAHAEDNTRNFRIWGETTLIDSTGTDPHKRGGSSSQSQVWVATGATLTVKNSHFSDSGAGTIVFNNEGTIEISGGDVELASTARLVAGHALVGQTLVGLVGATGSWSSGTNPMHAAVVAPPAVTPPVVVLAAVAQPAAALPAAAPKPAAVAASSLHFQSSLASERVQATSGSDTFYFNQHVKQGADKITGFGASDFLVTSTALKDGNHDGIIAFGKNGLLDLGSSSGTVSISDIDGHALNNLAFDGAHVVGDMTYFVYSLIGSDAAFSGVTG